MFLKNLFILLITIPFIYGLYNMIANSEGWLRITIIIIYIVLAAFYLGFELVELLQ